MKVERRSVLTHLKEVVKAEEGEIYDIELEADLLRANEQLATKNKELLKKHGVMAIDVMGAIGSGKTTLIEKLVQALKKKYRIAVFKGDLTTTLVKKALQKINLEDIDLLFIENVGNLICPADFPLGSEKRVVVISVTEGPYMVVKHPFIFMDADVAVINKKDLAQAMGVEIKKLKADVKEINPNVKVVATNGRSGEGVKEVVDALEL
jgi:hydrogenase nickel incorporation protein HypB